MCRNVHDSDSVMSVHSHTQLPVTADDATSECSTLRAPPSTIKADAVVDAGGKVSTVVYAADVSMYRPP